MPVPVPVVETLNRFETRNHAARYTMLQVNTVPSVGICINCRVDGVSSCLSSMEKWTKEATRHLIDLYREEPCLWNVKTVEYRNRDRKATALQKIAEHMNNSGWSSCT